MQYGKTTNGLQYAVKTTASSAAYCALSIKCGTRDEGDRHAGLAHFVEHTIFKGTEKKRASVINGYLDRLGGELNAFTTKEEIVLHATVLKEDLSKAANLLFELATTATFPEAEINIEKGVVIDEINSYKDSPSEDIYDRFEELLFAGHPLSTPILGTVKSVKKIDREELISFVREKFTPDRMAFTVVAGIEEKKLQKLAEHLSDKWLGALPGNPDRSSSPTYAALPTKTKFDKTINKKNHQVNCVIGNFGPSLYEDPQRIATILMCNILGGPASNSILNYKLREKNGLVYGVECSYTQYTDTGIVAITLGCDRENIEKCLNIIGKEIHKLESEPLSATKLAAAKKQFIGQMSISSDNGEVQCLAMGKSLLAYGHVLSDESTKAKIEAVTSEQIMQAAQAVFSGESLSRLIYL